MWVPKLLISPVIIRNCCPKTTKFDPNLALSIAGSIGALLVGLLVVVARGLYLARHLFSLSLIILIILIIFENLRKVNYPMTD